ncbi:MAG: HAMP domain-containing histidine kinase [Pseudooceanicola sp.]|nr:HAMP domain-containing histidine kinase [Pseudooceanicola sp.]
MKNERSFHAAVATVVVFLVLLVYAIVELLAIQKDLNASLGERNLWAVTQAEREFYKLLASPSLAQSGEDRARRFADQFEILVSRIALLSDGPHGRFLASIGQSETLEAINGIVADWDRTRPADREWPGNFPDGDDSVLRVSAALRSLSNETMVVERRMRAERQDKHRAAMQLLLVAISGALGAGLVMAAQLVRNARLTDAARAELQRHQATLEDTIQQRTRELREALSFERRAKDVYRSFGMMVSHQFRTPVSVIHMIAQRQLRMRSPSHPDVVRKKFQSISNAAERLDKLVNGVLASDGLGDGDPVLLYKKIDLNELVRSALDQTRKASPGLRYESRMTKDPLMIDADPVLIEQVFLNLLENAVKYSEMGTPIHVTTIGSAGSAECIIQDHGIGIPGLAQDAIFEKYYRAPNAQVHEGLGIGLSLSREIVALHAGAIRFSSTEGRGTAFSVMLPLSKAQALGSHS